MRRIIDKRKKEKFMLDDEYMNGQARLCGWQGTIAYLSLCRHSNRDQESFPSIKLIAEENGVSRDTIIKGLKSLEDRNVIIVKKKRNKGGKWLNNLYILQDKAVWLYDQVDDSNMDNQVDDSVSPSRPQRKTKSVTPTLRKHIEGNTYKDSKSDDLQEKKQIDEVISMFEVVNPSVHTLYGNTTQRSVVKRLLKRWTLKEIQAVVNILPELNANQYAKGKSITPYELEKNLGHIKAYIDQQKRNVKKGRIAIINKDGTVTYK